MVYINTTGKHNEVWLDKPYATITVECPDCPSTEDAYNSGWTDGSEDGFDSGWTGGYGSGYTDGLNDCSGETINNQRKDFWLKNANYDFGFNTKYNQYAYTINPSIDITYDSGYTGLERVSINGYILAQEAFDTGYDSGYTDGLNACSGGSCEGVWEDGYDSGATDQKNKLASTAITQNGTYTRTDGWSSVTINVSGYSQEDLDRAFRSGWTAGYDSGLTDCSGYTPDTGNTNVLDFIYETTSPNEKINLFTGDAQYTNSFFKAFYSAITFMEIDGVVVYPNPEDIEIYQDGGEDRINLYTHSFAQSGSHTVKFYMDKSFSASTITGTKYPAYELTELIFASNNNLKCPIVEANIGDGYEYVHMGVFQGSDILTSATIPSSVTAITNFVFENSALKILTCNRITHPSLGVDVFDGANSLKHIYVPASAVEDYKEATNWSNYSSIISAIQ